MRAISPRRCRPEPPPGSRAPARYGLAEAQLRLGQLLLDGEGAPPDAAAALAWFQRSAAQGLPEAMNMAGRCLENGWGASVRSRRPPPPGTGAPPRRAWDWGEYKVRPTCSSMAAAWRRDQAGALRLVRQGGGAGPRPGDEPAGPAAQEEGWGVGARSGRRPRLVPPLGRGRLLPRPVQPRHAAGRRRAGPARRRTLVRGGRWPPHRPRARASMAAALGRSPRAAARSAGHTRAGSPPPDHACCCASHAC